MSYVLKLAGALIGIFLLGILGIILFEGLWYRIGIGAAILVVCGGLLVFAWSFDRKQRAAREDLPPI